MKPDSYIQSIKDDLVIEARALTTSKGRLTSKKMLVEGEEQLRWVLGSPCHLLRVFVHEKEKDNTFTKVLRSRGISIFLTSDGILKKITDTNYLVSFVGVAAFGPESEAPREDLVVVLDRLTDFGNIGTIVRTAAAFGIRDFASTDSNQDFFYKKTIDASRGSVFSSQLHRYASGKEAVKALKQLGYQVAVTTPHASLIQSFARPDLKPMALVFGNETYGVSDEVMAEADLRIQIPMTGAMESLNVGVAAGISLYEMKIKLVIAILKKKITASVGRDLYCASKWIRLVFDTKLRETAPFTADQAVLMMILKCDGTSTNEKLAHDAGLSQRQGITAVIHPLVAQGLITQNEETLSLSSKGEESLAQIWSVHETVENIVFSGVSEEEKRTFLNVLHKIFENCEPVVPYE